jgi:hypothetical protein
MNIKKILALSWFYDLINLKIEFVNLFYINIFIMIYYRFKKCEIKK